MFNEAEPPCSYDFDVLYSRIADIGLHNVRSVPEADLDTRWVNLRMNLVALPRWLGNKEIYVSTSQSA